MEQSVWSVPDSEANEMAGSTLPLRALGRLLRGHRMGAGKSQLAAGLHIEISPQTLGRMEDGQKIKISTVQIGSLLDFYGIGNPSAERSEVLGLWDEVKQEVRAAKRNGTSAGWWRAYSDQYAYHFDQYLSLEATARSITIFQLALIPGLLQHPEYRRAMIRIADPALSAVDVERRLELAARRQAMIADRADALRMKCLLSEAVLGHKPGGRKVMAEQARYLADLSTRPNICLQLVPLDADDHPGLVVQSFTLLEFPPLSSRNLTEPPVVYVEGYEGALYLEHAGVIDRHRRAIAGIEQVALSESDTRQLFSRIAEEYRA
ncbi:helix-turn-helix domain-containing protein [Nocardia tengchongensis]|uniref:helix-turn-helix domain-containing protein n=2 Tax=Nocardia tengchongensis TaxID=2055889 RepID=UPI0036752E42